MKEKFLLPIFAMVFASLVVFSTQSLAAESLSNNLKIDSFKEHVLQEIKKEYPDAQFIDLTNEEYEELQKQQKETEQSNETIGTMGSAPPLDYLEVYAAISSNHPTYEYFGQNQLSSINDHGGTEMYIVTEEYGYGYQKLAKMNGTTLSEIQSQYIDYNGDSIIDGWYTWWDASGKENGTFSYQNTSTNYPWNTMTDSIYIQ